MTWFDRRRNQQYSPVQQRILNNPPLEPEYERHAQKLADLGTSVLSSNEDEAVRIGRILDRAGGMTLMVAVAERADALSLQQGHTPILRHIEHAWDGIGKWSS